MAQMFITKKLEMINFRKVKTKVQGQNCHSKNVKTVTTQLQFRYIDQIRHLVYQKHLWHEIRLQTKFKTVASCHFHTSD